MESKGLRGKGRVGSQYHWPQLRKCLPGHFEGTHCAYELWQACALSKDALCAQRSDR